MEDQDNSPNTPTTPRSVGEQLRSAREAQGLSLADISARTRVAERHLAAIEEGRFGQLAAPTYATGFSRAYARAVGLDERDIAAGVRRQLDAQAHTRPAPTLPSFEPGDPARVPPSRIAWLAGLLVIAVIGVLLVTWNDFLSPEGELPDLLPDAAQTQSAAPVAAVPKAPTPAPAAAPGGPVVLTATAPKVWVKVTDAAGNQLFQKELAQGESYTVPAEAQDPQLRTARADVLQITVGGRALPRLSDKPEVLSGVVLTPAALTERTRVGPAPAITDAPSTVPPRVGAAPARTDVPPVPKMDDVYAGLQAPPPAQ
jgi:cytoskeleton protein RodZ